MVKEMCAAEGNELIHGSTLLTVLVSWSVCGTQRYASNIVLGPVPIKSKVELAAWIV